MVTCILDFLNSNAGAITAIATVTLAILTAIYVLVTRTLAKEAKRQADLLLNERRSQLHRELIEKIYVPLSKEINPITECLVAENPPVFNEWTRIKEEIPFLAYRIKKDLFEKLDVLADIQSEYFWSYEKRRKELEDIIKEHFRVLRFWFIYNRDFKKSFGIPYLGLIFSNIEPKEYVKRMAEIQFRSQEIDEGLIEYPASLNEGGVQGVTGLDEFNRHWNKLKNKIEEYREVSAWLRLKQEMVSKSTDILADLEEPIRSNSDNAI